MKRSLIWFRNNLRIHDNESLIKACQAEEILPIYIFDPSQFATTSFGFLKTGAYRTKFIIESIQSLREPQKNWGRSCSSDGASGGCYSYHGTKIFY